MSHHPVPYYIVLKRNEAHRLDKLEEEFAELKKQVEALKPSPWWPQQPLYYNSWWCNTCQQMVTHPHYHITYFDSEKPQWFTTTNGTLTFSDYTSKEVKLDKDKC